MNTHSVSPNCYCCPLVTRIDEPVEGGAFDEQEFVDPKLALMRKPIVGMETITWEDGKGAGAIPARVLPSPKEMTAAQRVHDVTHLP